AERPTPSTRSREQRCRVHGCRAELERTALVDIPCTWQASDRGRTEDAPDGTTRYRRSSGARTVAVVRRATATGEFVLARSGGWAAEGELLSHATAATIDASRVRRSCFGT